jgi:hypothetical protein
MNIIYLYHIWMRREDLIHNPKISKELLEPGSGGMVVDEEWEPEYIIDPRNPAGVRYEMLKTVTNLDVARSATENSNGLYVYTITEAFYASGG